MLGVWIARRCSPKILFWIAYWRRDGTRVKVDVGVDSVMKVLAPKKKKPIKLEDEEGMATTIRAPPPPTRCLFLHVRVVQRVDAVAYRERDSVVAQFALLDRGQRTLGSRCALAT